MTLFKLVFSPFSAKNDNANSLGGFTLAFFMVLNVLFSQALQAKGQEVDEQLQVAGDVTVVINNLRGKVAIFGNETDVVSVKGLLDEKATDFIFEQQGSDIVITVKMPNQSNNSFWGSQQTETNLTIGLPKNLSVSFNGVSSDIKIVEVDNDVNVKTISGDIIVKKLSNRIQLETISGNIDSQDLSGRVSLSTISGNIKDSNSDGQLTYHAVSGNINATSAAKSIKASVISGDLNLTLAQVADAELSSVSGDVEADLELAEGGLLKMSSVSGDIELSLSKNLNADFKVYSNAGGRIINKLNDEQVSKAKYGPSSKLKTTIGSGGAKVKASTVSGMVKLQYSS